MKGTENPPKNSIDCTAEPKRILLYSPRKKRAK